jgi:hypothetical protein
MARTSTRSWSEGPFPVVRTGTAPGFGSEGTTGRVRVHNATIFGTSWLRTASIEWVTLPTFAGLAT